MCIRDRLWAHDFTPAIIFLPEIRKFNLEVHIKIFFLCLLHNSHIWWQSSGPFCMSLWNLNADLLLAASRTSWHSLTIAVSPLPASSTNIPRVFPEDHYPWGMVSVFFSERPTVWWITFFPLSPQKLQLNSAVNWKCVDYLMTTAIVWGTGALRLWAEWPEMQPLGPAKLEEFDQLNGGQKIFHQTQQLCSSPSFSVPGKSRRHLWVLGRQKVALCLHIFRICRN